MEIRSKRICLAGFLFGMFVLIGGILNPLQAFDAGYHFDLTRDALVALGVPRDQMAIKVVQIQNIYCDFWEQSTGVIDAALEYAWLILPAAVAAKWDIIFSPRDVRQLSDRFLHFDDLSSSDKVGEEWDRTFYNTYLAVQRAQSENDPMGLLTLLGITLHKVQDFYAHSNWSQIDWDGDATWFDASREVRQSRDIYTTGHDRLNKDNASRPGFDEAYREAFYASVQWAKRIKDWAGTDLWNRAMGQNPDNTDLEHRFARYLCWYAAQWKGSGLEEERSTDDMVALSLAYTATPVIVVREAVFLSKWKEYCRILTDTATRVPSDLHTSETFRMGYPERRNWLRLEITKAQQTDNDWIWDIDPGGEADFYTEVTVNGIAYVAGMYEDRDRVEFRSSPPYRSTWLTLAPLSVTTPRVSLQVKLMDEDCIGGGVIPSLRGDDDECDIHPNLGTRVWSREFTVAELDRTQYIETDGFRDGAAWYESDGDGDEAKVAFSIEIIEPPRGGRPPVITNVIPPQAPSRSYSTITIRGDNFYPYATVHFGQDIRVHQQRIVSKNEIQVVIHIPEGATLGVRACSVKTRCGTATIPFSVIPPPPATLTSVTPSSCPKGASADVVIKGDIPIFELEWVSFGEGISVLGRPRFLSENSGLSIRATIRISPEAPTGPRDVTVKQKLSEPAIGRGLFMVTEPPPTDPLITTVYPPSAMQGESLQVTIRGLRLTDVQSVGFGPGITVRRFSEVVEHSGRPPHMRFSRKGDAIEAFIVIDSRATLGDRMVTVRTRGGSLACGKFTVTVFLQ